MQPRAPSLAALLGRPAHNVAEVGVYLGNGAARLRAEFPAAHLHLIDPWAPNAIPRTYRINNDPGKWAAVERRCRARFANDPAVSFYKLTSHEALPQFADHSLDVVFLDAGREYALLSGYIGAWRRKLTPGGILAGKGLAGNWRGDVRLALEDFLAGVWYQVGGTTWAAKP